MKVATIAISPIWKFESRLLPFDRISVARPEVALAVLFEEEVRSAEVRNTGRLGDVLHAEGWVVGALAGQQRLAERVPGLARLTVRVGLSAGRAVRVAVQDRHRDRIGRVRRQGAGAVGVVRVGWQRVEDS